MLLVGSFQRVFRRHATADVQTGVPAMGVGSHTDPDHRSRGMIEGDWLSERIRVLHYPREDRPIPDLQQTKFVYTMLVKGIRKFLTG